jgi:hypothetical protein
VSEWLREKGMGGNEVKGGKPRVRTALCDIGLGLICW